jgi:hypothetical protein
MMLFNQWSVVFLKKQCRCHSLLSNNSPWLFSVLSASRSGDWGLNFGHLGLNQRREISVSACFTPSELLRAKIAQGFNRVSYQHIAERAHANW